MDLIQRKLTKNEWESIEIPVPIKEKKILLFIKKSFHDVLNKLNNTKTLLSFTKINDNESIHNYLYILYFENNMVKLFNKFNYKYTKKKSKHKKIKKSDVIRLKHNEKTIKEKKETIYEYILFEYLSDMLRLYYGHDKKWQSKYIILYNLLKLSVVNPNTRIIEIINEMLDDFKDKLSYESLLKVSSDFIERDPIIQNNKDIELYRHQKELFTVCKQPNPKLVLYIAPTGTGKTISPIGLSEKYKIIFVCAARHVGLALAKAAISVEKKVAFAFGCMDATDIRLHYFSAKEIIRDRKSGSIRKVDNSVGDKVEIMICDIKSYIPAMLYMKSFNPVEEIITYWDEPTITMDYESHEFHDIIKKNWNENKIPNMVLSSATLPNEEELTNTIMDFRTKFNDCSIHSIVSHDCQKTIPIVNKEGYKELPHYMFNNYKEIKSCVKYCLKNKTVLRNIDYSEIVKFILYINKNKAFIKKKRYYYESYFESLEDFNIQYIKEYYLHLLGSIKKESWKTIYNHFQKNRVITYDSSIYITTKDANTLTCGPSIYLVNDISKIAKFCIQIAKIPNVILNDIIEDINFNNKINKQIRELEMQFEDGTKEDADKEKKSENDNRLSPEMKRLMREIQQLQGMIKTIELNKMFVPNSHEHLKRFEYKKGNYQPFTCDINEEVIEKIMLIDDVSDQYKLLLMMGIGVFDTNNSITYTEVMKNLAQEQKLYLIIASSDYIYGTNYQFCHGYIGKDMTHLTQEKCIQAMGRVGRNSLQKDYSIRFRDNNIIKKLFLKEENKLEVVNMNKLFCSDYI